MYGAKNRWQKLLRSVRQSLMQQIRTGFIYRLVIECSMSRIPKQSSGMDRKKPMAQLLKSEAVRAIEDLIRIQPTGGSERKWEVVLYMIWGFIRSMHPDTL